MLKAVEKKRAYEDIVKQIFSLIERGKLKRGDQLPVERELSETFKVSRATVREAIFSLESMRLVQRRQGDGTYVIASSEEALVQPLAAALFHEKDDIIDIFSIRKIIEPEVAQLASEHATPEEIIEMEEILKEQERKSEVGRTLFRRIRSFIISWPEWRRTESWNASYWLWLTSWERRGRSIFRPRKGWRNPSKDIRLS